MLLAEARNKRIFLGLSGGVDSAVSAALLKQEGAEVVGVFIQGWYPPGMPCTWQEDRRDAMRVAAALQIPFLTFNASNEYKRGVIDYLLAEYEAGRTPNPDVMCNKEVKFGAFYTFAKSQGADAISTGHYLSGEKDQRYFLWAVPKEIFENTVFPVGDMQKSEVRKLAKRFDLPVAEKHDSQGVCFLGSVSVKEFLASELGSSDPALLRTLGERVEGKYVIGKQKGKLILADTATPAASSSINFHAANWFLDPSQGMSVQIRYRGPRLEGRISQDSFVLTQPSTEMAAPGQSIVFYNGEKMVGGGIIQ